MANPFEEFGGQELPAAKAGGDPFSEFGGQPVQPTAAVAPPPQPVEKVDPFHDFGGQKEDTNPEYKKLKEESAAYGLGDLVTSQAAEARGGRLLTKTTSDKDINTIAGHHKVDPKELRSIAPYLMALPPTEQASISDYVKRAAGAVGYGVLGDVPQWIFKKLQDDPNMRAAIDDVRDLAEGRMGAVEWAGYNFLPVGKLVKGAAVLTTPEKLLPAVAKGAATGAAYGVAGSREGEELRGAALGATVGGALGGAALGASKLMTRLKGGDVTPVAARAESAAEKTVDPTTREISLEYAKNNEARLTDVTREAWSRIEDSEKDIGEAAVKNAPLSDDAVERIIQEQLSPDSVAVSKATIAKKTNKEITQVTDRDVAEQLVAQRREEFADRLVKEIPAYGEDVREGKTYRPPTVDEIYARASGAGEERLIDKFLGESYVRTGQEQFSKLNIKTNPDAAPLGKLLVNGTSDKQFTLKTIDEVYGTNLLPHFLDVNTNYNHFTAEKHFNDKKIADLFKVARKDDLVKDLTDDSGGLLYKAMVNNKESALPGPLKEMATMVRSQLDAVRQRANTMEGTGITPLNIAKREDFGLPQILKKPVDVVIALKQTAVQADKELLATMGKQVKDLNDAEWLTALGESPSFGKLVNGIEFLSGQKDINPRTFSSAFNDITQRGASNPRLYNVAFTTLQRTGDIPTFLREKNVFQIMKRYSENTMRHVYLREPLEKLTNEARLLRSAGANLEAEYAERMVADNMGIRAFSMARLGNELRIKFAEGVDKMLSARIPDPERRANVVNGIRLMPELMANIQYNIYPNVLGLNPRAHFAQLTQTWFKNAPELGGTYGYELTGKSFLQGALMLRSKDARGEFTRLVRKYGLEPESFIREASEALATEAERHLLYNVPAKALRATSNAFMYTYGKMDTFNRGVTAIMAERLAADLNGGVKGAFNAVDKMPISIKRMLVDRKGDVAGQAEILAKYLNSTTQFNYNRASMSELGIIAGPFFSTFTKWPLATAGDIISDLRTKGLTGGSLRAVEKYGVTLLLASVMDNVIRYAVGGDLDIGGDFKDYDERLRRTLGTGGFVSMAPISSAAALLPGSREKSLFTPPLVDAIYDGVLQPALTGDTEQLAKQGEKLMKTFIPGGFIYRFATEDIPVWTTGEKP